MTELSFIDFKCPHCGETTSFPDDYAGIAQECPNCSETVIVPADGSEVGGKLPVPFKTQRLVLRRLTTLDWRDLLECLSPEEMYRYLEGQPLDEEQIIHWLESDTHVKLTTPNQPFYLGLELPEGPKLIGYVSLRLSDQHHLLGSLNFFVNQEYQRKGFASEALQAMLIFCFRGIGLHRVTAYCDGRHTAACRLLEKAGMRREGEFRKDRFVNGEWVNTVWYGMLKEEFA